MQQRLADQKVKYHSEPYNKVKDGEQWIRITDGCPHNCPYCYCPILKKFFGVPEIRANKVKIMDMNLLSSALALGIINELPNRFKGKVVHYNLICGIDHKFFNNEIAVALKEKGFISIRLAWDWTMRDQYKIKDAIKLLESVGYKSHTLMVFMICNWKISFQECCRKLDLLKVWRVKVDDCYYDNQIKHIEPVFWTDQEIKTFRRMCRKHNQLVNFGIDPEIK